MSVPPDFHVLFESIPALIMVLAPDSPRFTILAASDAYLLATRKRREEMIGRPVFDVFPENPDEPSDAEANSRASFERVLQRRLPDTQALQRHDIARPDTEGGGFETRFWRPLNTPVMDQNGQVRYIIHRVEDVTDLVQARKQAEQEEDTLDSRAREIAFIRREADAGREREEKYAALFENSPAALMLVRVQSNTVVEVNDAFLKLFGRSRNDVIGKSPAGSGIIDFDLQECLDAELPAHDLTQATEVTGRTAAGDLRTLSLNLDWISIGGERLLLGTIEDITERKNAERALRESEERFRSVLMNMSEGLMLFDPDGNLIYQNPASLRIHGFNVTEEGRIEHENLPTTWDAWDESGRQIRFDEWPVARVFKGERFQNQVLHVRRVETGQEFDGSYNGSPIYDAQGKLTLGFITIRDITEQVRATKALRTSEERLRLAQHSARIGSFEWNIQSGLAEWSPELEALYGLPVGGFDGKYETWASFIHPDDRQEVEQFLQIAVEQGEFRAEWRIIWLDGSVHWLAARALVFKDSTGQPQRMIGVNMDLTERKQAEQALQQSEARLRAALDSMVDEVWFTDTQGNIILTNDAAIKNLGFGKSEEFFQNIHQALDRLEIYEPDGTPRPPELAPLPRALRGETLQRLDELVRNIRTGQMRYREVSCAPVRDEQGHMLGAVAVVRDVTEQKHAEEELKLAATVFNSSSEAIVITDSQNKIIAVNPAFEIITGYRAEEVLGKDPNILKSGHHDAAFYQDLWKALETTGSWKGELWNRSKSGGIFVVLTAINTTWNADGSVQRRVAVITDITEKKRSEEMVWQQANFDTLTGLPNRRLFQDHLLHDIKKARRSRLPLALMFMDLDGFKEVNDALGHEAGDMLLKETGKRLLTCVRETDTVARLGGDEFTVILTELTNLRHVSAVAEEILQKIAEPVSLGDEVAHVTGSLGITLFPQDATNMEELLINADQAMYEAKSAGRNRFSFFTSTMQKAAQERMWLINELRHAIEKNQFRLVYQPIVELASGCVNKAEALLRWDHPERGLIEPSVFIPVAEETGMIRDIGDWIFLEAANQADHWRKTYHPDFQISINKSPVQFKTRGGDVSSLLEHLKRLNLPGQSIAVEITEGVLMDESQAVTDQLLAMRDAGIEVSLDDFGTGYSTLSYLKRFDIDRLKIDKIFIRDLETNPDDLALCEAMIVMGHKLGIQIIAEGVETDRQREILANAGCDYIQGYLLSSPVPAWELEGLLKQGALSCPRPPMH